MGCWGSENAIQSPTQHPAPNTQHPHRGLLMNLSALNNIVNAVLYEGYMLYPYRPSSVKNRQRWTFGGLYPQAYSVAHGDDAWTTQAEFLVVCDQPCTPGARIDIRVRFLHLLARDVGALEQPLAEVP